VPPVAAIGGASGRFYREVNISRFTTPDHCQFLPGGWVYRVERAAISYYGKLTVNVGLKRALQKGFNLWV
jgi:hypothetical protein